MRISKAVIDGLMIKLYEDLNSKPEKSAADNLQTAVLLGYQTARERMRGRLDDFIFGER